MKTCITFADYLHRLFYLFGSARMDISRSAIPPFSFEWLFTDKSPREAILTIFHTRDFFLYLVKNKSLNRAAQNRGGNIATEKIVGGLNFPSSIKYIKELNEV